MYTSPSEVNNKKISIVVASKYDKDRAVLKFCKKIVFCSFILKILCLFDALIFSVFFNVIEGCNYEQVHLFSTTFYHNF